MKIMPCTIQKLPGSQSNHNLTNSSDAIDHHHFSLTLHNKQPSKKTQTTKITTRNPLLRCLIVPIPYWQQLNISYKLGAAMSPMGRRAMAMFPNPQAAEVVVAVCSGVGGGYCPQQASTVDQQKREMCSKHPAWEYHCWSNLINIMSTMISCCLPRSCSWLLIFIDSHWFINNHQWLSVCWHQTQQH